MERPKILVCAVCLGDHSDDLNEIVTCDGCSVSVHEGCYGISDTVSVSSTVSSCSTEPWFCDACKAGVVDPPCELCPNLGELLMFLIFIQIYSFVASFSKQLYVSLFYMLSYAFGAC